MKVDEIVAIIAIEPELEGEMPEDMYIALQGDRDACAQALRIIVKQTKKNIINRIMETDKQENESLSSINQSVELQNIKTEIDDLNFKITRKAEIRRVAEQMWSNIKGVRLDDVVGGARYFVDNFDAQFERTEGEE